MQLLYVIFDSRFLTFAFFIKHFSSEVYVWQVFDSWKGLLRITLGVIGSCFVRLMKNSIPQGQVICVTLLQSLYMLRKQNKFLIHSNTI